MCLKDTRTGAVCVHVRDSRCNFIYYFQLLYPYIRKEKLSLIDKLDFSCQVMFLHLPARKLMFLCHEANTLLP